MTEQSEQSIPPNSQRAPDNKLARYEQALRDVIDPIGAMRRDLPPGYSLNGHAAVRAADNPETYKDIARKALGDEL